MPTRKILFEAYFLPAKKNTIDVSGVARKELDSNAFDSVDCLHRRKYTSVKVINPIFAIDFQKQTTTTSFLISA